MKFLLIVPIVFLLPATVGAPVHAETAPARDEIVAEITAYTSSADETDDEPDINASGTKPANGSLACPRRFALGTQFVIEGRRYTCDDRMNKRYTNRFDIWMADKSAAYRFGVKTLPVEIVR